MGLTALHHAVFHVRHTIVRAFLERGSGGASVHDRVTGTRDTSWAEPSPWYLRLREEDDEEEEGPRGKRGEPVNTLEFARRLFGSGGDEWVKWLEDLQHEVDVESMDVVISCLEGRLGRTVMCHNLHLRRL